MAGIKIIKDLKNTEDMVEGIKTLDKTIRVAATKLMSELLDEYSKAKNLSNKSDNEDLTDRYAKRKAKSGRKAQRDLNVTGNLYRSFRVKKERDAEYSIGPRGSKEQKIMEGQVKYDKNLMKVGDKARDKVVEFVNDRIKKGGK